MMRSHRKAINTVRIGVLLCIFLRGRRRVKSRHRAISRSDPSSSLVKPLATHHLWAYTSICKSTSPPRPKCDVHSSSKEADEGIILSSVLSKGISVHASDSLSLQFTHIFWRWPVGYTGKDLPFSYWILPQSCCASSTDEESSLDSALVQKSHKQPQLV